MFVRRRLPARVVIAASLPVLIISATWASFIVMLYAVAGVSFIRLPFLPIATIGTAVAFYIGFKNNSAYERYWEARKIWGGIVNASRTWGNDVLSYVKPELAEERRALVYRHMAWLNALRLQLRGRSRFAAWREKRRDRYGWIDRHQAVLRLDWETELTPFLSKEEYAAVTDSANAAAQIIRLQGAHLRALFDEGAIDLFYQLAMMDALEELYALQGKCERIKNTPFPRQYAHFAQLFTWLFVLLVPLGLLDVFVNHAARLDTAPPGVLVALMIVCSAVVSWVFIMMEFIGDNSEDPFECGMNDVPLNALCRTIEIDLRQMLGETELPPAEQPVDDVLY